MNGIEEPSGGGEERETFNLCQAGSNFQLIEVGASNTKAPRELSFSLQFHLDSQDDFLCQWLEGAVEFIEATVNVETDSEAAIPGELEVDQKLLDECKGISS